VKSPPAPNGTLPATARRPVCAGGAALFAYFYCAGVRKERWLPGGLPRRVTVVRRRVPFLKGVDSVTDLETDQP
jgi:hypothetical protein